MSLFDNLKPGVRENAFYLQSEMRDHYIYEWDQKQDRHIGKWVKANYFDQMK